MKERPILFSAPMVRALLAGTKTQTRRAIKDTDVRDHRAFVIAAYVTKRPVLEGGKVIGHREVTVASPYGQAGDRLWVRETWHSSPHFDCLYRANYADDAALPKVRAHGGWKPSIFMPRWASRLTLEVTGVRVERLQDISATDALAEGIEARGVGFWSWPGGEPFTDPRDAYLAGWDTINGKGAAAKNPWVWVISFRKVDR